MSYDEPWYRYTNTASDVKDTLRVIELNVINNCNRSCSFCPHASDAYHYKHGRMSMSVVDAIVRRIKEYNFTNVISVCGYGEPLLHNRMSEIISRLDTTNGFIELMTNGDLLTLDKVNEFYRSGLDMLNVSIYDRELDDKVTRLLSNFDNKKYILRKRYDVDMPLVNRIGMLHAPQPTNTGPCYFPSYKMMIDVDGQVLLCCNDWSREETFGNILNDSIDQIWIHNMSDRRMDLIKGNRQKVCATCDVQGTLHGQESVDLFVR